MSDSSGAPPAHGPEVTASRTSEISLKDAAVLLPLAASSMAVTYDVGYFWGLDIKAFTLFSLAEHIVFAFEAIPAALIAGLTVLFVLVFVQTGRATGRREGEELREKILRNEVTYHDALREVSREKRVGLAICVFAFMFSFVNIYNGFYAIGVSSLCLSGFPIFATLVGDEFQKPNIIRIYVALSVLITTFATGVELQNGDRAIKTPTHGLTLLEGEIQGVLIRSGERGLLFVEHPSKKLLFIKWDQIKRVSSVGAQRSPAAPAPVAKPPTPTQG